MPFLLPSGLVVLSLALLAVLRSVGAQSSSLTINRCVLPGTVALTLDDGPWVWENETVSILHKYSAPATFFVVGHHESGKLGCIYNNSQTEALIRTKAAGHQIGSLTWSHPDLANISNEAIGEELDRLNLATERILGVRPRYMRPAYGQMNSRVLAYLTSRGFLAIGWNAAPGPSPRVDSR